MRPVLIVFMILLFSSSILPSCNKDPDHKLPDKDSLSVLLPKQIIWWSTHQTEPIYLMVISLKYDTLNYRIGLYLNDTTNANPYDELIASYTFSRAGYLIETTGLLLPYADFGEENVVKIKRDNNNRIVHVETTTEGGGYADTLFYHYKSVPSGLNITTIRYDRDEPLLSDTVVYEYNRDFDLLKFSSSYRETCIYKYNENGSLKEVSSFFELNYAYDSILPHGQRNLLMDVLLGRDSYVHQLQGLYPFHFTGGILYGVGRGVNATNPYRFTTISVKNDPFVGPDGQAELSYQYDERNRLSKVIFKYDGVLNGIAEFRY